MGKNVMKFRFVLRSLLREHPMTPTNGEKGMYVVTEQQLSYLAQRVVDGNKTTILEYLARTKEETYSTILLRWCSWLFFIGWVVYFLFYYHPNVVEGIEKIEAQEKALSAKETGYLETIQELREQVEGCKPDKEPAKRRR